MNYQYGEEINYSYSRVTPEDYYDIQAFSCGNRRLDYYIHNELIKNDILDTDDGLPFKVYDSITGRIIGVFSLAASGIILKMDNYVKILPSIKIDIFAVDIYFQKMYMEESSKNSQNPEDHFYLSDSIMCDVIKICRNLSEEKLTANYIVLYADKKAKRFYERNMFSKFDEYMLREENMEIAENDAMYMLL